ncbi:MAG: carboxypeptidase regulatory-like domain-containing protein [Candidatus Acidiferrales bacterium]
MRRIWQALLLAFLGAAFLFFGGPVWGQATTSLRGAVTDPSNAAIPNATVHLTNTDTNLERTTTTDQQGNYVFSEVPPGHYVLRVEANGFSKFEQNGFELLVNLPATINVRMKIGSATQTVEVTAQAPLLNTTDASQGNTMSGSQISDMPLYGRSVTQLLSVQPGVVFTSNRTDLAFNDTRSGSVNGAHSDQNNITLDGVDVNDQGNGSPFETVIPVTVASVEEFRVTTADYGAEQGRSEGAQEALVTKGGTNKFHGSLYNFNRTQFGEANDFFNKTGEELAGEPNKPLHLVYNIFGGTIGGPIKHDRLFFFLNYEGHRQHQAASVGDSIPSPALADGVIQYPCATPSQCPGGTVQGASKTWTVQPGFFGIGPCSSPGPTDCNSSGTAVGLAQMDPLGVGPSPSSLAYFQSYYTNPAVIPNAPPLGDGYQLNFDGFRFPATQDFRDDIGIGRIDYKLTSNGNQTLFWRGSGNDNYQPGTPVLPGGAPTNTTTDFSKGMVLGYTAVITPALTNNFRYGLTKQSIVSAGDSDLPANFIRGINQDEGNYGIGFNFPVNNFTDDLSWTKGQHTFTFGTDVSIVHNNSVSTESSFSSGLANAAWLTTGGFSFQNRDDQFNPDCETVYGGGPNNCSPVDTFPAVSPGFYNGYDFPLIGLLGMISEVNAQYNVKVNSQGVGTDLAQGAGVPRHFALDETEFYGQDSWKIKPNLTFNYGLRYLRLTAPWETDGQEVAPTQDLGTWFLERGDGMMNGVPSNAFPNITFDISGRSNGRPDWWPTSNDFAPRFSLAWSPEPSQDWLKKLVGEGDKSVIRAGFGKYYDHYGQAMITTFDRSGGEFGLSTTLVNPAQVETAASSPRWQPISGQPLVSAVNNIPTTDNNGNLIFTPGPTPDFPLNFPAGNFCICWGLDSSIKTPYSYQFDFSVSRELPHQMAIEVAYVGRLGHNLLLQSDLAQPLNLTDPASGITYYQAAAAISEVARAGAIVPPTGTSSPSYDSALQAAIGPTAAYWQNLWTPAAAGDMYNTSEFGCGGPTASVVSAIYATYYCNSFNETSALDFIDLVGLPSNNNPNNTYFAKTGQYTWYDNQYSSLFAWRSQGWSHYESMQVTFKKQMSQGLQFNVNYTYSTSFDLASDAESVGEWSGLSGEVVNPWMGDQLSGPSDFDLRHQVNAQWVWQLPFGQGRMLASHVNRGLDAIIGGWQLSGLMRWSSGFPVSGGTCFCFPTNWQLTGDATSSAQVSGGHYDVIDGAGNRNYNAFSDPSAVYNDLSVPLPGTSGSRNPFRGDGFYDWDMEMGKVWKMPYNENHSLRLSADVFNVFNQNRFDVESLSLAIQTPSTFGDYSRLLTLPRIMQFGLAYQF